MKRFRILLLAFALLASSAMGQSADPWRFKMSFDKGMVITGFLHEFPPGFSRAAYPTCVTVTWNSPAGEPIPVPKQPKALDQFDDFVKETATEKAGAVLVAVSIGLTQRKWVVYAASDSKV